MEEWGAERAHLREIEITKAVAAAGVFISFSPRFARRGASANLFFDVAVTCEQYFFLVICYNSF